MPSATFSSGALACGTATAHVPHATYRCIVKRKIPIMSAKLLSRAMVCRLLLESGGRYDSRAQLKLGMNGVWDE